MPFVLIMLIFFMGFVTGSMIIIKIDDYQGGLLAEGQHKYAECLTLDAPQQNCLEKFLLPKVQP